jgi:hypothetical protein
MEVVENNKNKLKEDYNELLLPSSLKRSESFQERAVVINSVEQDGGESINQGKVFMLNYFDTNSGGYKKILVKKFNNKNA